MISCGSGHLLSREKRGMTFLLDNEMVVCFLCWDCNFYLLWLLQIKRHFMKLTRILIKTIRSQTVQTKSVEIRDLWVFVWFHTSVKKALVVCHLYLSTLINFFSFLFFFVVLKYGDFFRLFYTLITKLHLWNQTYSVRCVQTI